MENVTVLVPQVEYILFKEYFHPLAISATNLITLTMTKYCRIFLQEEPLQLHKVPLHTSASAKRDVNSSTTLRVLRW